MIPGGFSYGDYLRAGAIARFSPVMEAVARVRARGRAGARHLQRLPGPVRGAACCRARCCRTTSLRFVCRQVDVVRREHRHALHAARASRARCSRPVKHTTGRYFAPPTTARASSRRTARSCCATRPGTNPNGSLRDIAGVVERAGQRVRPDAAPRARGRPADRLDRRRCKLFRLARPRTRGGAGVTVEPRSTLARGRSALGPDRRRSSSASSSCSAATRTRSSWRSSRCCGPSTAPTSTRRSCCASCRPRASGC